MKLSHALPEAQAKQSLILLDLHSSVLIDIAGDHWITKAEASPAAARAMDGMVLAIAGVRSDALQELPDLARFKGQQRHLIVLDPWGGFILEPEDGFGDVAKFAFALNALRQQAPTFIHGGVLRREGKIAESLLAWAGGLLDAGAADSARGAFEQAESVAENAGDQASMQNARIGYAALDVQDIGKRRSAVAILEDIAAHPVTDEIASRAWMLLALGRSVTGDRRRAEEAYQKRLRLRQNRRRWPRRRAATWKRSAPSRSRWCARKWPRATYTFFIRIAKSSAESWTSASRRPPTPRALSCISMTRAWPS